jgi:uncharacterized protein
VSATDVMEQYVTAVRNGDFDTAFGMFAEDVVFRVPGRSALAGEHRGRERAMHYIQTARDLSHGADVSVEVIDALTSDERFALIVVETFDRPDGPLTVSRANVYRVRGDEIAEIWIFEGDQYATDELFGGAVP